MESMGPLGPLFAGAKAPRLSGQAAFQTLERHHEEALGDALPPWRLGPHEGHRAQGKLERLVDPESLESRVGTELHVALEKENACVFRGNRVLPALGG